MVSISSILAGFVLLLIAELRHLRAPARGPGVHRALQTAGYALIALAWALIALESATRAATSPAAPLLLAAAAASGALLIWTTFLEIPRGTRRRGTPSRHVYDGGSYAWCRHPGFWWFLLFSASLALWAGEWRAYVSFFIANPMNLLLIAVQDKYTFPVQFVNYREYSANVPFLMPKRPRSRSQ